MNVLRARVGYVDCMTRAHALVLTCACGMILLLSSPFFRGGWASINSAIYKSGQPGSNEIEIDAALQEAATAALGQRDGTIIILDPQSGRVRALVNPKLASAQAAMPGSTMKPFTALAALRAGLIDKDSRTVCPGRFNGLSFSLPCVHADHLPPFSPPQAIAYSCNYYFASLGERLGRDRLIKTLRPFGFGQATGFDEDVAGTLRPCEAGNSARIAQGNHASRQSDCAAREAIGESDHILVTPMQLLMAYVALVNGGHLFQPRAVSNERTDPMERATIDILPQHRALITEGLAGAVRYGTARSAHLDSVPLYILGKTGTAPPAKGFRTNGWFVGFAGRSKPTGDLEANEIRLAVLVLLERSHGSEAAALSKPIFEAYADAITSDDHRESSKTSNENPPGSTGDNSTAAKSKIKIHLVTENVTQELSLEDYVLGVMRAEGSMESEPEALKALAISIRTYALKNHGRHEKDGYDFCSTTHCQRFAPGNSSQAMIDAVRATAGQVLLDNRGQLADVYFGASCGGETANIGTLWGLTPPDYLRGVRDEYCLSGPHATWTDVISRADLLRAMQSDTRTNVGGRLDQIVVTKRDETGRAAFITVEGEHAKSVRGWDFKIIVGRVLGWSLLKSSRFEVSRSGANFVFRGRGFGHGLGLCQEGAHVMAARGASFQRILEKYFPGTSVKKEDRIATTPNGADGRDLTARKAKNFAEGPEENVGAPPRDPLRPSRLNASFSHDANGVWEIDVLSTIRKIANERWDPHAKDLAESAVGGLNVASPSAPRPLPLTATRDYQRQTQNRFTISSEHFRVSYPAEVDRRDANQVLSTLETARVDFLGRASAASVSLGSLPSLEIHLNESTGDFTARTGQPWWAAAATRGSQIELQPVALLKRRGVFTNTLRHELAHVVIDAVRNNQAPRWLKEGFALYLAGEGPTISRYEPKTKLTPDQLEKRLERPGSQQEMRALYAGAYHAVFDLINSGGESSVWKKLAGS